MYLQFYDLWCNRVMESIICSCSLFLYYLLMTEDQLHQIQQCADILRETIEKFSGDSAVIVSWGCLNEEKDHVMEGTRAGAMTDYSYLILFREITASISRAFKNVD